MHYTKHQLARGALRLGLSRLAGSRPFHAHVLEQMDLLPNDATPTLGVTVGARGRRVELHYNPEFVLRLSGGELENVLLHEVLHVVFGHVLVDAASHPDSWALTVSTEVTVNEFVPDPLPGMPIRLEMFPSLPPLESTRQRYGRLTGEADRAPHPREGGPRPSFRGGSVFDDHGGWGAAGQDLDAARVAVAGILQQAALEAGGVPEELRSAVRATGARAVTADGLALVRGDRRGQIDWRVLLRRFVGRLHKPRMSLDRPSRRCPDLLGVVAGVRRRCRRANVVCVVDTSGSVTDGELEAVDAEIRRMSRTDRVHVVQSDSQIKGVSKSVARLGPVRGRGGTDFRPALETPFLRGLGADAVVFFTDGDGPAPARPPRVPILWCLVPGGQPPAEYGGVIRMG